MAAPGRGVDEGRPRLKKVPQRTCVACRQTSAKRQLVRVVRAPDGSVTIDVSGKRSGRGAYLCATAACWRTGLERGVLPRALKIETIPEDNLDTLHDFARQLEPGQ
ncbi:MAG TPA: YlxR family protein [Chloroflexota bacterium]|jgi:hypothetical protein